MTCPRYLELRARLDNSSKHDDPWLQVSPGQQVCHGCLHRHGPMHERVAARLRGEGPCEVAERYWMLTGNFRELRTQRRWTRQMLREALKLPAHRVGAGPVIALGVTERKLARKLLGAIPYRVVRLSAAPVVAVRGDGWTLVLPDELAGGRDAWCSSRFSPLDSDRWLLRELERTWRRALRIVEEQEQES